MINIFQQIKWFIQRGRRGWADCDIWDLDLYLSEWLPVALRKFKDTCHGCPQKLYDRNRNGNECHHWKDTLEIMARGFDANTKMFNLDFDYKNKREWLKLKEQKKIGLEMFIKYFNNLSD